MITFVRHARTNFNNQRLFHGQLDIELSDTGIKEAEEKSKEFPQNYDICFCSPLKRTKQTAEILVPYLDINIDDRIQERNMGDWQGTSITDEKLELLRNSEVPPNGESIPEVDKRVNEFLKMVNDNYKDKNVIVVTHGGIIHSVGRILSREIKTNNHLEPIDVEM